LGKKIGLVIFWLVDEADEANNKELEEHIKKEVEKGCVIPWMKKVDKVTILDAQP
jgi:hypothetical protein